MNKTKSVQWRVDFSDIELEAFIRHTRTQLLEEIIQALPDQEIFVVHGSRTGTNIEGGRVAGFNQCRDKILDSLLGRLTQEKNPQYRTQ